MGASLSLDNVDPIQAWEPWTPTDKDPWSLKWAGHLYRRAAFGAPIKDLRFAVDADAALRLLTDARLEAAS